MQIQEKLPGGRLKNLGKIPEESFVGILGRYLMRIFPADPFCNTYASDLMAAEIFDKTSNKTQEVPEESFEATSERISKRKFGKKC